MCEFVHQVLDPKTCSEDTGPSVGYRLERRYLPRQIRSGALVAAPVQTSWRSRQEPGSPPSSRIVLQMIDEHFLTPQQRSLESTAAEVARRCRERLAFGTACGYDSGTDCGTAVARASFATVASQSRTRSLRAAAPASSTRRSGHWTSCRIDHTKLDVIVVDEQQRLTIGRPWITLAIESAAGWSRLLHLARSAGSDCDRHVHRACSTSTRRRGREARDRRIVAVLGFPTRIHLDYAKAIPRRDAAPGVRAKQQYGITKVRPVAHPHTWVATLNGCLARCCARSTRFLVVEPLTLPLMR